MNREKQLAFGMLCELPPEHELMQGLPSDPATVAYARTIKLEKSDIFSLTQEGRSFFSYREVWNSMDKVVRKLRSQGVDIKGTDFRAEILPGRSALDLALGMDKAPSIFTPNIWKGQIRQMDDAWYMTTSHQHGKAAINFTSLREATASAGGEVLRETQLKAMGLGETDIRSAIKSGNFDDLRQKLARHGDYLRREDIFLSDGTGDHMMDTSNSWTHFKALWQELARHGQRLEPEDFLFRRGIRKSIIAIAQEHNLINLFDPQIWRGRTADMLKVYSYLPDAKRAEVKIDAILDELTSYDYGSKTDFNTVSRESLTTVLNAEQQKNSDFHAVRPLSLKCVWERIDDVNRSLAAKGQRLTLGDLRAPSGLRDEPCLGYAARFGVFAKVIDIARAGGEKLTVADLTAKDKADKTIVDHLIEHKQLDLVLQPEDWVGRGGELAQLWRAIPEKSRDQLNYQAIMGVTNMLTLRQRFGAPQA